MSLETVLRWQRSRNPQTIYPHVMKKSSPNPVPFSSFSGFFRQRDRHDVPTAHLSGETEPVSPFWNRTHENLRFQMMGLSKLRFSCVIRDDIIQTNDMLSIVCSYMFFAEMSSCLVTLFEN